ncbi:unnamed protein product [Lactuca virosa]|uniref:Uncharacterized protein n=1 Tax=Lactuca virosa TaxID=75947 RepID=A0AAU9LYG2_9ASTR|nr:unnamed protein product [Lactuca virosa]
MMKNEEERKKNSEKRMNSPFTHSSHNVHLHLYRRPFSAPDLRFPAPAVVFSFSDHLHIEGINHHSSH